MTRRHEMTIEGRGSRKRKAVKTTKKRSAINRQMRTWQRQARNVLGGIGLIAVVLVLLWLITGGGF